MNKKSYFGYELLFIIIGLLIFFEALLFLNNDFLNEHELLVRLNENNYLLKDVLIYNNSFLGIQAWFCNNSIGGLRIFNNSVRYFLDNYTGKDYLLYASSNNDSFVVSSSGERSVCLKNVRIARFNSSSYCGKNIGFQFSLYTSDELSEC